jgi:hypothetical protein
MAKRAKPSGDFKHWPLWSNSQFWSFIRSGLRAKWSRYPVKFQVLNAAKRKALLNPRAKWEYQCDVCKTWVLQKDIEVDHIIPCGALRSYEDLPQFVERLFCGAEHLRTVCKQCHKIITKEEKDATKAE